MEKNYFLKLITNNGELSQIGDNDSGRLFYFQHDEQEPLNLQWLSFLIEEIIPEMRRTAKVINFGIMYGAGAFRISQELGISRMASQSIIDEYFKKYSESFAKPFIKILKISTYT